MVWCVLCHAVHEMLNQGEHRLLELTLINIAARFEPLAAIIALQLAQKVDRLRREMWIRRSGLLRPGGFYLLRLLHVLRLFHDDCSIST